MVRPQWETKVIKKKGMKTGRQGEVGKCVSGVLVSDPDRKKKKKMNERQRENKMIKSRKWCFHIVALLEHLLPVLIIQE